MNIHGALNIHTIETVVEFTLSVTKESTLRLCRRLLKKHPLSKSIHIWLDGVSYYTSSWLKEKLKGSRIVIHYLPSYSPNLNLIERLWKFFKKEILYNTYYETFEGFLSACKNFFRCRTKYKPELRSLLNEKFHLYKNQCGEFSTGRSIGIEEGRTEESLETFFETFDEGTEGEEKRSLKVKWVCSDMWKPYLNVIGKVCTNVLNILDRFHIKGHLTDAVNETRKSDVKK